MHFMYGSKGTIVHRAETVKALYNKLNKYKFIEVLHSQLDSTSLKPLCQVRGTPASGKSTLSVLIYHYIKQQEPTRRVIWIDGWHHDTVAMYGDWRAFLHSKGMEPGDGSIVIINDAQSSYWDIGLWKSFLQPISIEERNNRAIIFTSRGSATVNTDDEYITPMSISLCCKVTLRPIDHRDGTGAIGLFLTYAEFQIFAHKLSNTVGFTELDQTVYDWTYNVTAGDAGAATALLRFLITEKVCRLEGHSLYIIEVDPSSRTVRSSITKQEPPNVTAVKISTL
jgi:hypothetical protein